MYTPEIIRDIVEYARVRGVRVLPELDAPAHVGNGWQFGEKEGMGRLALCVNQAREQPLPSSRIMPMHHLKGLCHEMIAFLEGLKNKKVPSVHAMIVFTIFVS